MGRSRKILYPIWQEFVYGGHLLSLGLSGIVLTTILLLEEKAEWPILVVAYLISQITYTYNHYKEAEKDRETNPERVGHLKKFNKYFQLLISFYIIALIGALIYSANLKFALFVFFLFAAGGLYTKYFKNFTFSLLASFEIRLYSAKISRFGIHGHR